MPVPYRQPVPRNAFLDFEEQDPFAPPQFDQPFFDPATVSPPVPRGTYPGGGPAASGMIEDLPVDPMSQVEMSPAPAMGTMRQQEIVPGARDRVRYGEEYRPLRDALQRRSDHQAAKPNPQDPKFQRPLWQRLMLMGAAGAAGYVNAGGRTRVQGPSEQLLASRPKFDYEFDKWQTEGRGIDFDLAAAEAETEILRREEQDNLRRRQAESSIRVQDAHAAHYLEPPRAANPYMNTSRGVFHAGEGRIIPGTEPQQKPVPPTGEALIAQRRLEAKQIGLRPGSQEEQFYLANGKMPAPARPRAGGARPDRRPIDMAPQATFERIEAEFQKDLSEAEKDYSRSLVDSTINPDAAKAELERRKAQAQSAYDAKIRAAGGSITPRSGGGGAPPPTPAPAAGKRRPLSSY